MANTKITSETEVSSSELACVLGITGRNIRQLVEDGQLEKVDGRFILSDSVQRYVAFKSKRDKDDEEKRLEKTRLTADVTMKASKAQIAKMEADELRGKMHRSEDVEAMTTDLVFTIRSMILALPGRLAIDLAPLNKPAEISERIKQEVNALLLELSNYKYDAAAYRKRVRERQGLSDLLKDDDEEG